MNSFRKTVLPHEASFNRGDVGARIRNDDFPFAQLSSSTENTVSNSEKRAAMLRHTRKQNPVPSVARIETEIISSFDGQDSIAIVAARKTHIGTDGKPQGEYTSPYAGRRAGGGWKTVALSIDDKAWRTNKACRHTSFIKDHL